MIALGHSGKGANEADATRSDWMDRLDINADLQRDLYGQLLIEVQVNGKDFPVEDSCGVDLETFFDAISSQKQTMRFVGGCGDFDCCGVRVGARSSTDCWEWEFEGKTLQIPWSDVQRAIGEVITSVELLPDDCFGFGPQYFDERLNYFRHKLGEVQALTTRC